MQKEEVELAPALIEHFDLLGERLSLPDNLHADEAGEALVHRIDGDRRRFQTIDFFVARQVWPAGEAAERQAVRLLLPGQELPRGGDPLIRNLGRFFTFRVVRLRRWRSNADIGEPVKMWMFARL